MEKVAANWLCLMPYAYMAEESNVVLHNAEWQWWGEKKKGIINTIVDAKKLGYQIMLKPHLWKHNGAFTGDHEYVKEEDWKLFEKSYREYILNYVKLADSLNVELFCIGTEWGKFVAKRGEFWDALIKEVRVKYKGKITYAANWDEYQKVSFWKQLDYIGVDAYFPLVNKKTPEVKELKKALSEYKNELEDLSEKLQTPILFTEYGFRSRDFAANKPWESDRQGEVNIQTQVNCYKAFYQSFWDEEYVAGGFIWKWFVNYNSVGGESNNDFTPQRKLRTEKVIKEVYSSE